MASRQGEGGLFAATERAVGRWLTVACRIVAGVGGAVLIGLVFLSVISITGRSLIVLGFGPVPGDFELVEAGTAFAVFCFLPWCQIVRGHVTVDIFAAPLGPRRDAWLAAIGNLLMTLVAAFIAWRLEAGLVDKSRYNETSFILQFPLTWAYGACLPAAWLFVVVCAYTVWRSVNEALGAPASGESAAAS